jgi:hypothetical protein
MGKYPGTIFLIGVAATGWQIYDIVTAIEGQSETLLAMKYAVIVILVIATIYSGGKWLTTAPPQKPKASVPSRNRVRKGGTR